MFNATELLGQLLQCGIASSTVRRLRHVIATQGSGQPDGPPGASSDRPSGPGLAESAPDFLGADPSRQGPEPLAIGGGRAVALLDGLALSALGRSRMAQEAPPRGPDAPQDVTEAERLERSATLILAAMINAAKADGQVDQEELQRIVGRLRAAGVEAEALDFLISELRKPMDLDGLIRKVPSEEVAVQLYAASLLAIEVDTEAERHYLRRLAHGLGLEASVVRHVHQCLGMAHA